MSWTALQTLAGILFGAGLTVLTATLLGRTLLARLFGAEPLLTRAEGWSFSLATGAALLSQGIFFLCALGLVYDGTFLLVSAVVVGMWWRWGRGLPACPPPRPEQDARIWWVLLATVAAAYAYIYVPHALAPEIQADAAGYHLGLIGHTYRAHGFPGITTNIYAFLSQGAEMLYLFAYAFGRHTAAKLCHFSLFVATLIAMVTFARRYRVARAGAVGAGLYLCAPVVGPVATSAYNDCALVFFAFMAFYAAMIWWRQRQPGWLILLGIFGGFCFSIKYTGVFRHTDAVGRGRLGNVAASRRRPQSPPPARTRWSRGFVLRSPVAREKHDHRRQPCCPVLQQVLPEPPCVGGVGKGYRSLLAGYSHDPEVRRKNLIAAPLEVTVRGIHFQGLIGPVFLLAPLLLFAWRTSDVAGSHGSHRRGRHTLVFEHGDALFTPLSRFCLDCDGADPLPIASLSLARRGLCRACFPRNRFLALGDSEVAPGGPVEIAGRPWAAALRIEPEAEYLRRWVPWYRTAEFIAKQGDAETRVLSLEPLPEAYFPSRLWVSYQGARNEAVMRVLLTGAGLNHRFWPSRRLTAEWPGQDLSGLRIEQRGSHEDERVEPVGDPSLLGRHKSSSLNPTGRFAPGRSHGAPPGPSTATRGPPGSPGSRCSRTPSSKLYSHKCCR